MAPINKNPNMARKPTGTVPKTTSSTSSSTIAGTATIKQSTNSTKSSSSRKNTEIVAPTRRELNDLNDYLLSVAESTKQQNSGGHPHLDSSCFELENLNFQENQRFCWPVRPIPRRNIFNKDISENHPTVSGNNLPATTAAPTSNVHLSSNYHINNNSSNISASSTTSTSNVNSAAAVGVVIPTTPSTSALEDNYNFSRLNLPNSNTINNHQSHSNTDEHNTNQPAQHLEFDGDLTWDQRLKFIQYFLSLTSKSTNKVFNNIWNKMVNEYKTGELIVNSTSLEDVAQSEASDTRAQSVTSIHTLSGPTTPTYDELQTKLESSNRNIQNIKEQQQQLLRLQQTAKQHLTEMEQISSQAKRGAHYNQNGTAPPEYETVEQVHSDMSNLVNRMKNLTTFIQGQHELSALLGEDGPEILAEQEALQRKLEELKNQRQEMKNLVTELQEINSVAEKSCQNQEEASHPRVVPVEYQRVVPIELIGAVKSQGHSPVLNGHYQQQNGIHHNGVPSSTTSDEVTNEQDEEEDPAEVAEANDMIRQKMADINAMKNQLKRLKDMMETVRLIEEKGDGKDPKDIGMDPQENAESHQEMPKIFNRNEQPSSGESERTEALSAEEEMMTEKVRLLQEMTQDLREQAVHLATERDRLKSIKDEMKKRKDGGNKTSNREISPATMMNNTQVHKETEKQLLKAEYENKKKEFDKICQRLQSEEETPREEIDEALHESEINSREQEKREAATYYSENWRRPHVISANSSVHGGGKHPSVPLTPTRGKESADSGAADIHGIASLEAGSLQSGSSRSFSMPPPMRTINTRDTPWRKTSQDNSQIQFDHYAPVPSLLPNWNSYYHYNIPYSQQFSPHQYHSSSAGDCICTNQFNSSSLSNGPSNSQPPVPTPGGGVNSNDPVLLQQFIHTQQMLINSVCQCNQLLWHQQREINSLNNAVLLLQQRLLNSTVIGSQEITSIASGARAESVPPNNVSNNLYNSSSRAPSETPHLPPAIPPQPAYHNIQPTVSPRQFQTYNCCNSFQHRRNVSNVQQQNHHHSQSSHAASYNYAAAEQGVVFGTNNLCSQLPPPHGQVPYNNLAHPPQQQQQQPASNYLNNDAPNTVNILPQHTSPPIFMRHHNNTISSSGGIQQGHHHANNNSNLLSSQQNCLNSSPIANGSQVQTGSASVPNSSSNAAASALNNQVAPGNRANNYWDNFRSYSRQNLLSSNSCKSNEEQNQQQISPSAFGANATVNTNFNGMRNLQHLNGSSSGNSSANSNNLTPPIFDNKYFHTFRNQINSNTFGQHQQQQQHHSHPSLGAGCNITAELSHEHGMTSVNNMENLEQQSDVCVNQPQNSNQQALSQHDNSNNNDDLYNLNNNSSSNNNNSSNSTAIFGSPDFRNMNFNFGFNELKKKIPFKTSCNTKRLRATQSAPLNDYNMGNQRFISIDELAAATSMIDDNFNPHHVPQHITNVVNGSLEDDGIQSEGAVGIDETSDEIKRNLLFNALKSDKFTSKFFETLKEDVYREIYAIIQATESQPHYLIQLFKELQLVSTSDPLRNIIMQAMHDLYKRCTNDTESSDGYNDLDFPSDNSDSVNHFNTTSSLQNNNNNDNSDDNGLLNLENNRDNEVLNSLVNSQELRRLAYKIMFESTSPSRVGKGKKSGGKCDTTLQQDTAKIGNEFYRPDYELVNHVITNIRSVIRCQHIDDGTMIRIAKLTFSSLENVTSTIGRNNIRIDRSLISPKELYRKMKTFNTRDRENFLSYYESYLQTVFVMKIVNEDANNVNLANKKSRENTSGLMSPANALSLTNEDVLQLRRHAQVSKSNIPIIASEELNLVLPEGRKTTENESVGISITGHFQASQQTVNLHQSQQENLINADELGIIFNNPPSNSVQEQVTSPGTASNNIMNEDLAEADQVCSANSSVVTPLGIPGSARSSFSSDQPGKRTPFDGHLNNREIPKLVENEDCSHSIGTSHHSYNPSSSAMNRESLEDGYDGLAFGKFHPSTDQSSSETLATGNSDAQNPNNDAHSVVGEAACALVFPIVANESTLVNSDNCAMRDNSSDINTSAGGNCGTGTGKRNSVP